MSQTTTRVHTWTGTVPHETTQTLDAGSGAEESDEASTGALKNGLQLYHWMRTAAAIDRVEIELVARGAAQFQVSGRGHEAMAALALALQPWDYLHCHYRDKALMLARGLPVDEFFDSLLCNAASHSAGRQMSAHMSSRPLNILSIVGPVGNSALQAVGVAQQIRAQASRPIVTCSIGDGTAQQGEVLEAIGEAVRTSAPVLFLIEDNRYAISSTTRGGTFYSVPGGLADAFHGLPIHPADGRDAPACLCTFRTLVARMRATRRPEICVVQMERLSSHTNADDERVYRPGAEIDGVRDAADPVALLRETLIRAGEAAHVLDALDVQIDAQVRRSAEAALSRPPPGAAARTIEAPRAAVDFSSGPGVGAQTMAEALCSSLRTRLAADPKVTLYGQDIEDPKGDVFRVTRGLSTAFPGRVLNSPLSESTIVGTCIGRALAGGRPVAFIQFADFLPLAFNQIACELASMAWRTQDAWTAPLVILAPCGGYRAGLGPFHSQTHEALFAHLPGIDVAMPATATDAASMLEIAFASERPTLLLYPKALLHGRPTGAPDRSGGSHGPRGRALTLRAGDAVTLVGWGNTVAPCEQAAAHLATIGTQAEVIDLRWLAPWDADTVVASCRKTGRLVVVHEDNRTAGFGAEVVATAAEALPGAVACRRVARADSFLPCHFGSQLALLPSVRGIVDAAAGLLGLDVAWDDDESARASPPGRVVVPLMGSSPTDETAILAEIMVTLGSKVAAGQHLATVEADKAAAEMAAPCAGIVTAVHLEVGRAYRVGEALITIETGTPFASAEASAPSSSDAPRLIRSVQAGRQPGQRTSAVVRVCGLAGVPGSGRLANDALAAQLRPMDGADRPFAAGELFERTGIESRVIASSGEDVITLAERAARRALAESGLEASELALVICCTSTPAAMAPSTACRVMARLAPSNEAIAYDVSAACSGYLYALGQAWDFLQQQPSAHVLILTSEIMRSIVDPSDPSTSPLFGDAATATVLSASSGTGHQLATLRRPVLGAAGTDGSTLSAPLPGSGQFVRMEGRTIFAEGARRMIQMLGRACWDAGIKPSELDLVVPHQANGRMVEAMRHRLRLADGKVWNEIRVRGNTSSSSIPLALSTALRRSPQGARIGLCAFGAGYTFGAAIMERT